MLPVDKTNAGAHEKKKKAIEENFWEITRVRKNCLGRRRRSPGSRLTESLELVSEKVRLYYFVY